MGDKKIVYCSFCGKSQDEVLVIVAGIHVCICDECVNQAKGIVDHAYIERLKNPNKEKTELEARKRQGWTWRMPS